MNENNSKFDFMPFSIQVIYFAIYMFGHCSIYSIHFPIYGRFPHIFFTFPIYGRFSIYSIYFPIYGHFSVYYIPFPIYGHISIKFTKTPPGPVVFKITTLS